METATQLMPTEGDEHIRRERVQIGEHVAALAVTDDAAYARAADLGKAVKTLRANLKVWFYGADNAGLIPKARAAWQALMDRYNAHDEPLAEAERAVKQKMATWIQAEERRKAEEASKARQQHVAQEEEVRLHQAEALKAEGRTAEADAVLSAPIVTAPAIAQSAPTKVHGVGARTKWEIEVVDPLALVRAIAADPARYSVGLVTPNETALRKLAEAVGDTFNVPGVVARKAMVVSLSSKSGR